MSDAIGGSTSLGRVVIVGSGPTGLGAAYRLKELGHRDFMVYERHPYIGGLSHSFLDEQGFTWDIGGHVMFSHYKYYDEVFEKLMGQDFTLNNRDRGCGCLSDGCRIHFRTTFAICRRRSAMSACRD